MISSKTIKELAKREKKKIGNKAIVKIEEILLEKTKDILTKASRQADFRGRSVIREEDV